MYLADLSVRRPVLVTVTILALAVVGLFSYAQLAVEEMPNIDIPYVLVTTVYPGASPETVERELSKKIEEAVNPIAGIKHVTSYSREGVAIVVCEFRLEEKVNDAAAEVRAKVSSIRRDLPDAVEEPVIQKLDFGALPVVSLAVQSRTIPLRDLTTLVDKKIKRRFENLPGVGKVEVVGGAKREIAVTLDPARLEGMGMGVDEVIGGLRSENVNSPLGRVTRGGSEYALRISGKPPLADDYRTLAVASRGGRPVALGDVATVTDGAEEQRSLALYDGVRAVGINVVKQSGANVVELADRVWAAAEQVRRDLPPGVELAVVTDTSTYARDSLADVKETLIIGALLTVLIVFLFLNSWRATVITGLTLPVSVIASFSVMYFMGMSLNMMTMMALSLAIGLLIDDSIVVLENIYRHREQGEEMVAAARGGTSEIGLAVVSTTFSILAVFVPVAFMKGIVGRFFFQFGLTVAFAVAVSLYVSFTLVPMLTSRWHDPSLEKTKGRSAVGRALEKFNIGFEAVADWYKGVIAWALDHRKTVVALAFAFFVAGIMVMGTLPSNFMPSSDRGEFNVSFSPAPGASIEETQDRLARVLAVLKQVPEVAHSYATIGAGDSGTVRDAALYVKLTDKSARERRQAEIIRDVRARLNAIPGIQVTVSESGGFGHGKQVQIRLRGDDLDKLKSYGRQVLERVRGIPGMVDPSMTMQFDIPEYRFTVDRERSLSAGVATSDIVRTLGVLVGGQAVTTFEDPDGDAVDVRVRLPAGLREDPEQVKQIKVTTTRGGAPAQVPLGSLVDYRLDASPSEVNRQDLSRQLLVEANLDGIVISEAMTAVRAATADIPFEAGYGLDFTGEAERMGESFGYMAQSLILAVVFVYLILSAQFDSFIVPLAIMFALPLSVVGMAGALRLTGDAISVMALIGLIMLMGLVTKNAILLVDYAQTLQKRGMERREAVILSGRTRLRPIIMTTLAMIFGMMPLALALGAGGEFRAPMARSVVGGLITSTVLTLVVVPVAYTLLDDLQRKLFGRKKKEEVKA